MTALLLLVILTAAGGVIAVLSRSKRRFSEAKKLSEAGDDTHSIEMLKSIVEAEPLNAEARWMLAVLLEQSGDLAGAHECSLPLIEHVEKVPAEVILLHARCLLGLDDVRKAFEFLRPHTESAGIGSLVLYIEAAEMCGEINEAIHSYRQLEKLQPLSSMENYRCGHLLSRINDFDASIEYLHRAYEALPQDPDVARAYGEALKKTGRSRDAWMIFRELYNRGSNSERILLARTYVDILQDIGNIAGAVDVLEQIIKMPEASSQEAAEFLCLLGDIFIRSEKPGEAQKSWRSALAIIPNHLGACQRLGIAPMPTTSEELIEYTRSLSEPNFQKLFERILVHWGYTIIPLEESSVGGGIRTDKDSLLFAVTRDENGKIMKKLVSVKRWENQVSQFPVQDLKEAVMGKKFDGGVFITMSQFAPGALVFAAHEGNIELFSGAEIVGIIGRMTLPPGTVAMPVKSSLR